MALELVAAHKAGNMVYIKAQEVADEARTEEVTVAEVKALLADGGDVAAVRSLKTRVVKLADDKYLTIASLRYEEEEAQEEEKVEAPADDEE